jgi:hypothetical protein
VIEGCPQRNPRVTPGLLRQSRNSLNARPKRCDRLLDHESLVRQVRHNPLVNKECGEAKDRISNLVVYLGQKKLGKPHLTCACEECRMFRLFLCFLCSLAFALQVLLVTGCGGSSGSGSGSSSSGSGSGSGSASACGGSGYGYNNGNGQITGVWLQSPSPGQNPGIAGSACRSWRSSRTGRGRTSGSGWNQGRYQNSWECSLGVCRTGVSTRRSRRGGSEVNARRAAEGCVLGEVGRGEGKRMLGEGDVRRRRGPADAGFERALRAYSDHGIGRGAGREFIRFTRN